MTHAFGVLVQNLKLKKKFVIMRHFWRKTQCVKKKFQQQLRLRFKVPIAEEDLDDESDEDFDEDHADFYVSYICLSKSILPLTS